MIYLTDRKAPAVEPDEIILLQGADLDLVLDNLATGMAELRIAVVDNTVRFKLDNQQWSPGLGELDPACAAGQRVHVVQDGQ